MNEKELKPLFEELNLSGDFLKFMWGQTCLIDETDGSAIYYKHDIENFLSEVFYGEELFWD